MKLKSVKIENFRAVKELELSLHPQLTVVIGDNAAGKTTIMDAIAYALNEIPYLFDVEDRLFFHINNFRQTYQGSNHPLEQKMTEYASIGLSTIDDLHWTYKRFPGKKEPDKAGFAALENYIPALIRDIVTTDKIREIPVVAYYSNNRNAIRFPSEHERRKHLEIQSRQYPRFWALKDAVRANPRFWGVFHWFIEQEDLERREREKQMDWDYKLPLLEAVRNAITQMIPGASLPRTELQPSLFLINLTNDQGQTEVLSLQQLSDGCRTLLAIVIDLARRMAQANPHLENPLHSEAVALIDEVDLHLHPKWQQTVLTDLMRTFPNAQFIVTTHSPQVLTTIGQEHILELRREDDGIVACSAASSSYGAKSGRLLEDIMDVSE